MLKDLGEIAPRALAIGAIAWGAFAYVVAGPEVASRVARVDYMDACNAVAGKMLKRSVAESAQALEAYRPNRAMDRQAAALEQMLASPIMHDKQTQQMMAALGMGGAMESGLDEYKARRAQAEAIYTRSVEELREISSTELARTEGACGCAADYAISQTQTAWAVYVGSLGVIRPAGVGQLDELMTQAVKREECARHVEVS